MWRPLGVKSHWENKNPKKTKMWRPMGIEKPLGNNKKQNVETNGGEKPLGNQKNQKTKCGDQWG